MNITRLAMANLTMHELTELPRVEFDFGYTAEDFEDYEEDSILDCPGTREEVTHESLKACPYMNSSVHVLRDHFGTNLCLGFSRNGRILLSVISGLKSHLVKLDRVINPPGYLGEYAWDTFRINCSDGPERDLLWLEDTQ